MITKTSTGFQITHEGSPKSFAFLAYLKANNVGLRIMFREKLRTRYKTVGLGTETITLLDCYVEVRKIYDDDTYSQWVELSNISPEFSSLDVDESAIAKVLDSVHECLLKQNRRLYEALKISAPPESSAELEMNLVLGGTFCDGASYTLAPFVTNLSDEFDCRKLVLM